MTSDVLCHVCGKQPWLRNHSFTHPPKAPVETPERAHARGVAEERTRCAEVLRGMRARQAVGNIPSEYMDGWVAAVNSALRRIY